MADRWFEDYVPGAASESGPIRVEEAEVVEFGQRYDPQPFHVDRQAAEAGPFGGLIASGWHTCALMMRLVAEDYLSPVSSLGWPGIDELRWISRCVPVTSCGCARRSRRRGCRAASPTTGWSALGSSSSTKAGVIVLRLTAMNLVLARSALGASR